MPRHKILVGLMAITLAVVAATVIVGITNSPPESAEARAESSAAGEDPSRSGPEPEPQSAPRPDEEEEPAESTIASVPIDGQDVADALRLSMWKFHFRLPENQYTGHLWIERWTRDADEPEIRQLGAGFHDVFTEEDVVLQLPSPSDPQLFIRLGGATYREADPESMQPPTPWRMEVLDDREVEPDRDVHLITFTHNESGTAEGGLSDIHRNHDVTVYVKLRFIPGPFVPFEELNVLEEPEEESDPDESGENADG